jgi:hypothetical protein
MTAATTMSAQVASGVPLPHSPSANVLMAATVSYSIATTELELDDIVQMVKVPAGATVYDVILVSTDVDTNGTPTAKFDVGDGADDDYYIAASTIPQAGGIVRSNALTAKPKTYTVDDTIDLHVDTAAATAAAGTVSLTVIYSTP